MRQETIDADASYTLITEKSTAARQNRACASLANQHYSSLVLNSERANHTTARG